MIGEDNDPGGSDGDDGQVESTCSAEPWGPRRHTSLYGIRYCARIWFAVAEDVSEGVSVKVVRCPPREHFILAVPPVPLPLLVDQPVEGLGGAHGHRAAHRGTLGLVGAVAESSVEVLAARTSLGEFPGSFEAGNSLASRPRSPVT